MSNFLLKCAEKCEDFKQNTFHQQATSNGILPSRSAVFVRLDDDHLDGDGGPQQVDHLLVGERGDGHLADLHQPAALPQPRLPGEAEGLHVGHDALEVDVETELPEAVPPQGHLGRLAASGGDLGTEWK